MKKKKWYDTWWGLLWTLALVDAHPGQGIRKFMEVDEELKHLPEFEVQEQPGVQPRIQEPATVSPRQTGAAPTCRIRPAFQADRYQGD